MSTDGWPTRRGARTGTVTSFEGDRGLGTVAEEDGTSFDFHCAAIADGTRDIEVGRPVTFEVHPGHQGRLEARQVVKR